MTLPETDFESLPALVALHARQRPDAPVLLCGARRWTWRELDERAEHHQAKPADTAVVYIGFRCVR